MSKILLKRLQKSKGADVPKSARRGRAEKDKGLEPRRVGTVGEQEQAFRAGRSRGDEAGG